MPTNGDYNFTELSWEKRDIFGDPENPDVATDYIWLIFYVLERENFGTNTGPYYAESSQLQAEPTQADVEELILSLFPEGTRPAE